MEPLSEALPRWDTSNIYSSLEGDDYRAAWAELESMLETSQAFADAHGIRRRDANRGEPTVESDEELAATLEDALELANAWARLAGTVRSFIQAFATTDSYNVLAARELSRFELLATRSRKLGIRLQGWIGSLAPRLPGWIAARPRLASHAFFLNDAARQSRFLMSEELENLAADLVLDSGVAFGKLQGNVTSQLKVPLARDGKTEMLPITVVRNLCFDADAAVRERAYRAELAGWESIRITVAACLNAVKGTALTLARRRGRESVLDVALDDNRIDRATLDAMLGSIRQALPVFRRYLKAKARKLGLERLRWCDIFAPLGSAAQELCLVGSPRFPGRQVYCL